MNVYPSYSTKELSDFSIGLVIPCLVTFACQWTPECSIGPVQMLLNGSGSHCEDGRILTARKLLFCKQRIETVKLKYQLIFLWWKLLIDA